MDSMEFRTATSARSVMLMQTSHHDALKWEWNWNCNKHVTYLWPTKVHVSTSLILSLVVAQSWIIANRQVWVSSCTIISMVEISNGKNLSENHDITLTWYLLKFVIRKLWKTLLTSQWTPAPVAWHAHSTQQQQQQQQQRVLITKTASPFATQSRSSFARKHWRHLGVSKAWSPSAIL